MCRLIDYETYRFEQKKREKEQKKKQLLRKKSDVVRELRITSRIDDHDLSKKTENANKFLLEGHKVCSVSTSKMLTTRSDLTNV